MKFQDVVIIQGPYSVQFFPDTKGRYRCVCSSSYSNKSYLKRHFQGNDKREPCMAAKRILDRKMGPANGPPLHGPMFTAYRIPPAEQRAEGSSSSYSHTKIVPESSYPSNPVPSSGPKTGSQMELAMESGTGSGSVAQPILVLPQATVVENGQPSPVSPNVVPDAYTLSPSPSSPSDPFDETLGTLKGMTASLNNVATKLDDIQRVLEKQQLAILEALRAAVSVNVSVSRRKGRKDRTRRGKAKEPSQGQMAPPGKEE